MVSSSETECSLYYIFVCVCVKSQFQRLSGLLSFTSSEAQLCSVFDVRLYMVAWRKYHGHGGGSSCSDS